MKIINLFIAVIFLVSTESLALTATIKSTCQNRAAGDFSNIILCYREKLAAGPVNYFLRSKTTLPGMVMHKYQLTSQSWSPASMIHPDQWKHDVDMYIPEAAKSQHALIVINNGNNNDKVAKPTDFPQDQLAEIARATSTIVISISTVPNQPLIFSDDKQPLIEDDSIARSWTLFMDNPAQRELMPLHIPMAAAVSQAIRVAKQELTQWDINKFIVTGASKRGWAAWLASISDQDVAAVVPFVIDLLGTQEALKHIYLTYGGNWPVSFYPYYQQGIDKALATFDFTQLMKIEDPLQYMDSEYKSRLDIPKYIINASGDDFFVPDNSRFYYDKLPGEKSLRVVPNTDHYGIKKSTQQSLISFVNRFQSKRKLPSLIAVVGDNTLTVNFSETPVKLTRWTAINPSARDFRYACGVRYTPFSVQGNLAGSITFPLNNNTSGFEATFVEAIFNDGYVATTQVYITPNGQFPSVAPPVNGATCRTLPGRGLGEDNT